MANPYGMSDYDWAAWQALEEVRRKQLSRRARNLLPEKVRNRAGAAGRAVVERAHELPGADELQELAGKALEGLSNGVTRAASGSLRRSPIIEGYRDAGHEVTDISDIRGLDLKGIDRVKPSLNGGYMTAGAASGVAAGFVVAGGQAAAVIGGATGGAVGAVGGGGIGAAPGAGVGAAPGAATVIAAIAADAAAATLASTRLVFHSAAYYGYDVKRPEERLRALAVLSFGTARDQAAKQRALLELNKLARLLVRSATWKQLDENVMTHIIRRVLLQVTERMTKQKLAGAVPIAGIVIGAGINMRTLDRVGDAADLVYRERFLREKYGIAVEGHEAGTEEEYDDSDIPLADIVEEEAERGEHSNGEDGDQPDDDADAAP